MTLYRELLDRKFAGALDSLHARSFAVGAQQAVRWNLILANPADFVDLPRQDRPRVGVLSVEQARIFMKAISGNPHEALFARATTTGMRSSEYLEADVE